MPTLRGFRNKNYFGRAGLSIYMHGQGRSRRLSKRCLEPFNTEERPPFRADGNSCSDRLGCANCRETCRSGQWSKRLRVFLFPRGDQNNG
jgi:hypothetical protein